jgi:hypothetical protein
MAKLSARGRKEVYRVSRETDLTPDQNSLVCWRKVTYAVMSDHKVLTKTQLKFRSDGQRSSGGWTEYASVKVGTVKALFEKQLKQGWTLEGNVDFSLVGE